MSEEHQKIKIKKPKKFKPSQGFGRDINKTNPFKAPGQQMKQTEDNQEEMQQSYKVDYDGWAPMKARLEKKRELRKKALWDTEQSVPGMRDPGNNTGAPWMGMGSPPDRSPKLPMKRYKDQWQLITENLKKYVRTPHGLRVDEDIDSGQINYTGE